MHTSTLNINWIHSRLEFSITRSVASKLKNFHLFTVTLNNPVFVISTSLLWIRLKVIFGYQPHIILLNQMLTIYKNYVWMNTVLEFLDYEYQCKSLIAISRLHHNFDPPFNQKLQWPQIRQNVTWERKNEWITHRFWETTQKKKETTSCCRYIDVMTLFVLRFMCWIFLMYFVF